MKLKSLIFKSNFQRTHMEFKTKAEQAHETENTEHLVRNASYESLSFPPRNDNFLEFKIQSLFF